MGESDQFGFLPINRAIVFDDGAVEPLPSLEADIALVRQATHRDGYLYPPRYHDHASHVFEPSGEATERPAHLHRMPPSHVLRLDSALAEVAPFRRGDGALLMHFVALMFGYRLQFHEWWFDTRLPMFPRRWRLPPPQHLEGRFLSDSYRSWRSWPSAERTRFISLLYMHVRSTAYEWDWERFAVNYMVFDGCYEMAEKLRLVSQTRPSHAGRFNRLFRWLNMPMNDVLTGQLVRLRNHLFHEALWDQRQPGAGWLSGPEQADHLSRINDRLLFALAGYRGQYLSTPWWVIGQASLAP